ncbi:hypothetical protein MgSA37_03697 [Mucilaginibacter gotjawali]|uniref:Uncharacterized protein n=2 Tax=Mucilaginibacter gotjawali TaxID=1550579 RepID=A0A839SLF5_9SPHI|nr:hypothetical protein [Mucilaginibacter gotjawali]BAU55508.1 hypothetical protein MgSA37_03697 [Mucilaginibacter gotjawali]
MTLTYGTANRAGIFFLPILDPDGVGQVNLMSAGLTHPDYSAYRRMVDPLFAARKEGSCGYFIVPHRLFMR